MRIVVIRIYYVVLLMDFNECINTKYTDYNFEIHKIKYSFHFEYDVNIVVSTLC